MLLLHLWGNELFLKGLGTLMVGFMAADEDVAYWCNMQWARILVRLTGRRP